MFLQNVSILKYQPREGWTYRGKVWSFCVCVCIVLNQTPFVENNSFQRPHTTILQPSSVAKNEIPRTCNAADFCLCTSSHCSHCLPPSLSGFANKREWPLVSSFKWITFPLFLFVSSLLSICRTVFPSSYMPPIKKNCVKQASLGRPIICWEMSFLLFFWRRKSKTY